MVKRIIQFGLLTLVGLLAVAAPVYATSVTNALYVADIVAQNTGEDASYVVAACPVNTQALIDGEYVTGDLLNTALQSVGGSDIPYMPGVGTNPWCFWVPSISASEQKAYSLYAGGPAMQTGFCYFPGAAGMATDDSASLELGDDFTIEQKGYFDTSSGTVNLLPDGVGDYTNIASQYPESGAHWDKVDDPPATPDDNITRIYTTSTTQEKDAFALEDGSISEGTTIDSITVFFRFGSDTDEPAYCQPYLRLGTDETAGTEQTQGASSYGSFSETLTRPGGGDWSPSDIPDLQVVIGLKAGEESCARCTAVYIKVDFTSDKKLVYKEDAFITYISAEDAITSKIIQSPLAWQSPTSATGSGWSSPSNTYDDDTDTYSQYTFASAGWGDYLYLNTASVNSSKVRYWITRQSSSITGIELSVYYDGGWHGLNEIYTWGSWQEVEIGSLENVTQARIRFNSSSTGLWVRVHEFDFYKDEVSVSVTATGVSPGEHTVKVTADGTDLKIYIDDAEKDSEALGGASVPDNGNDWSFATTGSIPYIEYHKIWVGGTLKQHIVYERDVIFDDLTSYNNDATPTFYTTSSNPDITASLQNFRPITEAECTAGGTEETPEMLTETPEQPPEFYGEEGEGVGHLPGAETVEAVIVEYGGIPSDLLWILLCYGGAALAVIVSYGFIKSSLLFPAVIGFVIILFFGLTTGGDPIPLWTLIPYIVISGGVLVLERMFGW